MGSQTLTYVINVEGHVSRFVSIKDELNRLGLEFKIVPTVDGNTLSSAEIEEACKNMQPPHIKRPLSNGEIACFLSHIEAWKCVAAGNAPYAIICEDDARFDSKVVDLLDALENHEPQWDILRLFSHKHQSPIDKEILLKDVEAYTVEKITMSTVAYIITKPAAKHLIKEVMPFFLPIDGYLKQWWVHGLCSKQVSPSIAWPAQQGHQTSTIQKDRSLRKPAARRKRFLRNLRFQWQQNFLRRKHIKQLPLTRQHW